MTSKNLKLMSESSLKRIVMKDLATLPNTYALKTQERARKGVPDIFICVNGKFVAIELKREGKKATPLQENRLEKIKMAKGFALETTPSTWPAQFELLKALSSNG